MSSFHNGSVDYCTTSGTGDIEENARPFFILTLYLSISFRFTLSPAEREPSEYGSFTWAGTMGLWISAVSV